LIPPGRGRGRGRPRGRGNYQILAPVQILPPIPPVSI
jgi:hypothetical protein